MARVYTPKDFEVSRIMGDIVDLVAEHHGVAIDRLRSVRATFGRRTCSRVQ